MYNKHEVFSWYEAQNKVLSDTKQNISIVRKLYFSKKLIPKESYIMVFKKGQKISDWFNNKLSYSKKLIEKLCSEPHIGFYADKACLMETPIAKRLSDFIIGYHIPFLHK